MVNETLQFDQAFAALTGTPPFPWQRALYELFIAGKIPKACNLPTGLGKTSVLAIWLIALTAHPEKMPRRLVYVVNRRTVVDQTTDEITSIRARLTGEYGPPHIVLWQLRKKLQSTLDAFSPSPLAISTLRGQFADNREWSTDPSLPAIICGTVDMIGSRLLFSGYGVGFKGKPLHAGFLGQDVLLVHDEAHLEPAFQELLIAIEKEQVRCSEFGKFRVMELTATSRGDGDVFKLTPEDGLNPTVRERIRAKKTINLRENKDEKKLAEEIADAALELKETKAAILVFVRKVDDVDKITKKLPKGSFEQLTGTIRGKERDALIEKPIFKRFLPNAEKKDETVYLVCTSAGEVGVNISADHLVCDLSTFESMAQRFGRVNRFGKSTDTQIRVVYPATFGKDGTIEPIDERRQKTLALLQQLDGDGSPMALGDLPADARLAAFAPPPIILPTSDILFDAWALTTIRDKLPGRPPVEPYLHGISSWEPPETYIAWREEVGAITDDLLKQYTPTDLLEDYPLKPHELLRDNSARVFDRLKKLKTKPETPVWIVSDRDSVDVSTLGKIQEGDKEALYHVTLLLPPEAGGLSPQGMLDPTSDEATDVADEWYADKERKVKLRIREWGDDVEPPTGMRRSRPIIDVKPDTEEEDGEVKRYWHWFEVARASAEGKATANEPYELQPHLDDARDVATGIVDRLKLAEPLRTAVIVAAMYHDLGKDRTLWQRSIGNLDPSKTYAKSGGNMWMREFTGYRHEYGSLRDVITREEFAKLDAEMQDLTLHLIAAHHGRARPHFSADEAFEVEPKPTDAATLASDILRRFARLQRKYGRWGLAYLESLVRAADIKSSQQSEKGGGA